MATSTRQMIGERFEIDDPERDLLGRGGTGDVYRGRDVETGQIVAIKALRPEGVSSDPDAIESDGRHYLVLEYVPGGSLRDLLEQQ